MNRIRTSYALCLRGEFSFLALLLAVGCAGGEAVTPGAVRDARRTWERANLRDYDLEWTSASGPMDNRYRVTVRGGRVTKVESLLPDGRAVEMHPARPSMYGVDGLFTTIEDELAQLDSATPFGQPRGTRAVLHFAPDPKLGYPRSYRRDVLGGGQGLAIDVVRLAPAPSS